MKTRHGFVLIAAAVACLCSVATAHAHAADEDAAMQASCGTGATPSVSGFRITPAIGRLDLAVTVDPKGCPTTLAFEYGLTQAYGQAHVPTFLLTNLSNVSSTISFLQCSSLYHVRATATNANGTNATPDLAVSTLACPAPPIVTTTPATEVSSRGAAFHGTAVSVGGIGYFEYGTTTEYGVRTLAVPIFEQDPGFADDVDGPGGGRVGDEHIVTGLLCGTEYHYRAVLEHPGGTATGEDMTFVTGDGPCGPTPGDFEGDDRSELTVWRPADGTWYSLSSTADHTDGSFYAQEFGSDAEGDVPLLADIDGDGKADRIVWRASTATWYWLTSSTGYSVAGASGKQWGSQSEGDVPLTGDIDGDGKTELIVWRASTGTWFWLTSYIAGYRPAFGRPRYEYSAWGATQWGNHGLGDIPFTGDVDGDGKSDLIVWRASSGTWYWLTSGSGFNPALSGRKQWGNQGEGDVPLVGDLDGDGKADLMVWRASTGTWFWLTSSTGYDSASFGVRQWGNGDRGDTPVVADIDGDGKTDLTVWRPNAGTWYWLTSSSGFDYSAADLRQWGAPGDVPVTASRPIRR